jgi:hypothetical protein
MGRLVGILIALTLWQAAASAADWPPKLAELELTLHQAAASCIEGEDCTVYLRLANEGTAPFEAPVDVRATSATPAIPGASAPQGWACRRDGYSGFACRSQALSLAPGHFTVARLNFKMLPTPLETNEVCVSLSFGGTIRDAAMASAAQALGRTAASLGFGAEELFGAWGKGDIISANDKACLKVVIARPPEAPSCEAGFAPVSGACADLAALCTAGRTFDEASKVCACATGQSYDAEKQTCAPQLACDGERIAAGHFCACPQERPRWNAEAKACEALAAKAEIQDPPPQVGLETPEPAEPAEEPAVKQDPPAVVAQPPETPPAPVVESTEPAKPIVRKKIIRRSALEKPKSKRIYRVRREVRACPRGQIRAGGICQTPKPRVVRVERKKVERVARFLPCPPGYKLGPLGRRCWSMATLDANRQGANVRNKWVCAAGLRRRGLVCVSD